tara:strand:+ start:77396 stop:78454 length:1059 start_codon:yes stop_codon:yes gene_type:complete
MKKGLIATTILLIVVLIFIFNKYKSPEYKECLGADLFVVNKLDHSLSKIDLSNKEEIKTLKLGIEPHEVIVSSDEKTLIVSDFGNNAQASNEIHLVDPEKFEIIRTISLEGHNKLHGICLSPNPEIILVTSEGSNSLIKLNIVTGKVMSETKTNGKESHMVLIHPQKPLAFISNIGSNDISVINYQNDSLLKNIYCGKGTEGISISPDGSELWLSNKFEDSISIIDTESLEIIDKLKTDKMPVRLAISPDGKYCVSSNHSSGNLNVFETKSKKLIKKIEFPGSTNVLDKLINDSPSPAGLLFHPNKPYLFVINSNADRATIISMEDWKIIGSWKVGDIPDGIALIEKPFSCD